MRLEITRNVQQGSVIGKTGSFQYKQNDKSTHKNHLRHVRYLSWTKIQYWAHNIWSQNKKLTQIRVSFFSCAFGHLFFCKVTSSCCSLTICSCSSFSFCFCLSFCSSCFCSRNYFFLRKVICFYIA